MDVARRPAHRSRTRRAARDDAIKVSRRSAQYLTDTGNSVETVSEAARFSPRPGHRLRRLVAFQTSQPALRPTPAPMDWGGPATRGEVSRSATGCSQSASSNRQRSSWLPGWCGKVQRLAQDEQAPARSRRHEDGCLSLLDPPTQPPQSFRVTSLSQCRRARPAIPPDCWSLSLRMEKAVRGWGLFLTELHPKSNYFFYSASAHQRPGGLRRGESFRLRSRRACTSLSTAAVLVQQQAADGIVHACIRRPSGTRLRSLVSVCSSVCESFLSVLSLPSRLVEVRFLRFLVERESAPAVVVCAPGDSDFMYVLGW